MDKLEARAMTWEERESFAESGLDPMFMSTKTDLKWERDFIRWIMDNVYKNSKYAKMLYPEVKKIAYKTYEITVAQDEAEIKNS